SLSLHGQLVFSQRVAQHPVKQALIESFCSFGQRMGFSVVAEGIETEAEVATLRSLGATLGQGYHLGRPGPLEVVLTGITPLRS
ncbi:MAG: EAL domain-containing protein, partial [Acidimicrobiales bacterium]